ncbi:hypothetical protein [Urechidicola croceus]|uniref:Uncharacterized protein n=1 Tax=Urechidicola croceus TaxID=1850246 RepID=A0A1D8P5J2_9FLAO|nr:hypothetical protein [Urechidicola croceus]AOW19840.1 hypothetical protein LPB138_03690 [Urechidicola croceus]
MESNKIDQLLDKYLNAETTLQEEAILQDYFVNGNVAPHLEEYQALFGYFAKNKTESYPQAIQLNTKKKNWKWLSMVASVALLFSVYAGYQYNEKLKVEKEEARIAFENTQKAFELLSNNLNKGASAIAYLEQYETTTNKIFKQPKK